MRRRQWRIVASHFSGGKSTSPTCPPVALQRFATQAVHVFKRRVSHVHAMRQLRIVTHVIDFHLASPVMLLTIQDRCSNDTFPEFRQWLALQHESRSSPLSGVTLPEFGAPNAPPRPNITVTAEVVVRFGTTMVLQPDDSFPRFPATQGEAAAVHFTLGETTVLCPDYTIPPHHDASRRR